MGSCNHPCIPTAQVPFPPCSLTWKQSLNRFKIFQDPEVLTNLVVATITYTDDEFSKLFFDASALQDEMVETVSVFDLKGNAVLKTDIIDNKTTSVDLSALPEGTYTVQIGGLSDYTEQQNFKYTLGKSDVELSEDIIRVS